MAIKKKSSEKDAPPLPAEAQPAGSGATTAQPQQATQESGVTANVSNEADSELMDDPNTDVELAEAAEEPMVEYTGPASRREITSEQWQGAGVADMPTVVWERHSGFKVPKSVFSEQALQVLRQDGGFRVP